MRKVTGAIIGIIIVAFAVLVGVSLKNKAETTANYSDFNLDSIIEGNQYNGNIADHVKGNPDAPVLIFEYADYQCPGCASINPYINTLLDEYGDQLGIVYRNYLLSYHQNGTAAATAAEAAGLQGYWKPFADLLFSNQSTWEYADVTERGEIFRDLFSKATDGAGDLDQFTDDIEHNSNLKQKISFDMGAGDYIGVTGTPSLYLDGEKIDWSSASTKDAFLKLFREKIDAKLKRVQAAEDAD